jgi:hypothetical protein
LPKILEIIIDYEKSDFLPYGNNGRADPFGTEYLESTGSGEHF